MARNKIEMKFYGEHACEALFQYRPADIIRVYVTKDRVKTCANLLKWCAQNKKAYHVVTPDDLEKVSTSVHHEGIMILAKAPEVLDQNRAEKLLLRKQPTAIFYFDGVQNPHNIGSVARTAAHFSVPMIIGEMGKLPLPTPAMYRIAQGACEHVKFAAVESYKQFFKAAKNQGYKLVSSSSHATTTLYQVKLPEKVIFLLGNEVTGISSALEKEADVTLAIPGSGIIESLNVAVSAGLLAGEFWRQRLDARAP